MRSTGGALSAIVLGGMVVARAMLAKLHPPAAPAARGPERHPCREPILTRNERRHQLHWAAPALDRIIHAAGYSWLGLKPTWARVPSGRRCGCVVATPLAFWLGAGLGADQPATGLAGGGAGGQLLNSAVEAVVDRVSYEP